LQGQDTEQHGRDQLPDGFRGLVQPEVALFANLDEVVEEPDHRQRRRQREDQDARRGRTFTVGCQSDQMRTPVPGPQSRDDRDATHRRGTTFGLMALGSFDPDLLAEALP
jgi:hypothetical protein